MANQVNLEYQLGEDWIIDFDLNDQALADIDLTGATIDMLITTLSGVDMLLLSSADTPSSISIDSPTSGTGTIQIKAADQVDLVPDVYNYEIKAKLADLKQTVQIFGTLTVLASLFAWPAVTTI